MSCWQASPAAASPKTASSSRFSNSTKYLLGPSAMSWSASCTTTSRMEKARRISVKQVRLGSPEIRQASKA